jgi:hypothetical protein
MPKAAASQVIIHRIELQETERELLKSVVTAYSFRNVTKGIFNLTSDVTTVVILLIIAEVVTGKELITGALLIALATGQDIGSALADMWNQHRQTDEYREGYHQRASSFTGGLWNLLDSLISQITGEPTDRFMQQQEDRSAGR